MAMIFIVQPLVPLQTRSGRRDFQPLGYGGESNDRFPTENGEIPLPDWSLFVPHARPPGAVVA
jgi:hypothetical protein